jgi:hypothetical protein
MIEGLQAFCIRVERTRLLRLPGADVASHARRIKRSNEK